MPIQNPSVILYVAFKPQLFAIRNPKHLEGLKITLVDKPSLTSAQARRIRTCKLLRNLDVFFPDDAVRTPLYATLCKVHRKTLHNFNAGSSSSHQYSEIIKYPQRYSLNLGSSHSWAVLFRLRSLRFLKVHIVPSDDKLTDSQLKWIFCRLHCSLREFIRLKEVEIVGNIVNKTIEKTLDQLLQTIHRQAPTVNLEVTVWDNDLDNLQWLDLPVVSRSAASVYFVNRCHHANMILKPIQNFPLYKNLQMLEFWMKLFPGSDFLSLERLSECQVMQELRLRFEFELDVQLVSQKFLTHMKFPKSLTYLSLYISGLRLFWIGETPQSTLIEADRCVTFFLEQFEKLEQLKTFSFTLYEFVIEFSPIIVSILKRLSALEELFLIMVLKDFEFKAAERFSILDFGSLSKQLSKVFNKLKTLSIEFPCIFLDNFITPVSFLQNIRVLSLGYRIVSKGKTIPKLTSVLDSLNSSTIREVYIGDCNTQGEEEFKKRFDTIARLSLLQNLTIAITIKTISVQLFDYFCMCVERLCELRRFSCRFERAIIEDPEWISKLKILFVEMNRVSSLSVISRNGKIDLER